MVSTQGNNKAQVENNQEQSDFEDRLVSINRVTKVVKGGRRFSFSALAIVGDRKGRVGHGTGKAIEVAGARSKATESAKRKMVRVPLREGRTIHHDVMGKYGSGKVILRSAPPGTGIIAGGPLRAIFECLGINDVVAKSIGSSNPHNMVKACFNAFDNLTSPRAVAEKRDKKVGDIVSRRESTLKVKENDEEK